MYKNINFLSVKFIIIYSQTHSLSECFSAKNTEKRRSYCQHYRFPGNLYSAATFGEVLQRFPTPEKEENYQAAGNCPSCTVLLPIRQPQQLVYVGCGQVKKDVGWTRGLTPGVPLPCEAAVCPRALPCPAATARAGWATGSRGGSHSFAVLYHPAGLMPFYSCKANICAGGFLKIWLKINMILVCLYSGQSQPSDSFRGNILLRENLRFRKRSETSTFISHALSFGVLCTCFKWDGLELMDGVLPSVFYSLKISKCRHFIFIS